VTPLEIEHATSIWKVPGSYVCRDTDCANRVTCGLFSASNQIPG